MRKIIFIALLFSFSTKCTEKNNNPLVVYAIPGLNGRGSGSDHIKSILGKECTIVRVSTYAAPAFLILTTAVESLIINSQIEFLGVSQKKQSHTLYEYFAHNLANAFPTVARWANIPIERYTQQGPMVEVTNLSALTAICCLFVQNYCAYKKWSYCKTPMLESSLLTTCGYLLAWTIRLGYGGMNFINTCFLL